MWESWSALWFCFKRISTFVRSCSQFDFYPALASATTPGPLSRQRLNFCVVFVEALSRALFDPEMLAQSSCVLTILTVSLSTRASFVY